MTEPAHGRETCDGNSILLLMAGESVADPSSTSRRQVLQLTAGVAGGILAVKAASAAIAPPASPAGPPDYPKPPFPQQQQPWPGLTSKMTPRKGRSASCQEDAHGSG
jgi:hypothetical protein